MWFRASVLASFICMPTLAHAQLAITEIMYAPEGADSDREWIEVCVLEQDAELKLSEWVVFENDTNHNVSYIGAHELLVTYQECAIIADDSDSFLVDYPNYTGALYDSVFSLKNSSEEIILKENDAEIDVIVYSSDDGGKDNGYSLHRKNDEWVEGDPNPGEYTYFENENESTTTDTSASSEQSSIGPINETVIYSYDSVVIQPPEDVFIRVSENRETVTQAFTYFSLESYDATGSVVSDGRVSWVFGDGAYAEGRDVSHAFLYPGTYITRVFLEYGELSAEAEIQVRVHELNADASVDPKGDWFAIKNMSTTTLDVSHWRAHSAGQYFIFPEGTRIEAGGEVKFPLQVTRLRTLASEKKITLVFPSGIVALTAEAVVPESVVPDKNKVTPMSTQASVADDTPVVSQEKETFTSPDRIIGTIVQAPHKIIVPDEEIEEQSGSEIRTMQNTDFVANAVVSNNEKAYVPKHSLYWYGLVVLILLGMASLFFKRRQVLTVEGYEIIDISEEEKA